MKGICFCYHKSRATKFQSLKNILLKNVDRYYADSYIFDTQDGQEKNPLYIKPPNFDPK